MEGPRLPPDRRHPRRPLARHARDLLTRPGNTVTSIARLLGVSRNTVYKYVPELKGGRVALAEAPAMPGLPSPARPVE
ncbi:helix-turn-helix domain-containing protein [Streptomyces huiliensis]|uniref:helix-turn-helix domain-containing protein n=1 Tax=Streptomyces huiliensis TaxID=2876027 RepID=UPI001CBBA08A